MKEVLLRFSNEIDEVYKAYRMAHFSLIYMSDTYHSIKESNPQIENFIIEDQEIEIKFNEAELLKNREQGIYQRIIAGSTIAMFYNIWEDKYRVGIANVLSIKKNDIKSDLFKELNIIRQSITHYNFQPFSSLDDLKIFSFVGNSDILNLTSLEVQKIKELLIEEIENINRTYFS